MNTVKILRSEIINHFSKIKLKHRDKHNDKMPKIAKQR